jgi:hypothetical protein
MAKRISYSFVITILMATQLMSIPLAFAEWKETDISREVPLPRKITIVPPSPDLPKEIAAFSGRWEGNWEARSLASILIVEEINLKEAKVISAWGKAVYFPPDYERLKAKVVGKEIQFTSKNCRFNFVVNEDLKSIHGERDCPGGGISSSITMKKIE